MTTWKDYPDTTTPITAAALNSLEDRANNALNIAEKARDDLADVGADLTSFRGSMRFGVTPAMEVAANGYLGLWCDFDTAMPTIDYIPLAIVGGDSGGGPQLVTVSLQDNLREAGRFGARLSNRGTKQESVRVYFLAIAR